MKEDIKEIKSMIEELEKITKRFLKSDNPRILLCVFIMEVMLKCLDEDLKKPISTLSQQAENIAEELEFEFE